MKRLLAVVAALAVPAASAHAVEVSQPARVDADAPRFLGLPLEAVELGAGVQNYTGDPADNIAPGPAWGVRAVLDASRPVDLELNYQGGVNSLIELPDDGYNMYTNGLLGAARINPIVVEDLIEPFATAGIGFHRLSVSKDPEISSDFRSDWVGSVPLALGVQVNLSDNFFVTGRGQYDLMFDNEILPFQESTSSDRLGLTLNVGLTEF